MDTKNDFSYFAKETDEEMERNNSYRKVYLIKQIERNIETNKKSIAKDIALLGASALAVGIGALGIVFLGDDLINSFKSGDSLTLGSYILVKFQGAGVSISVTSVLGGIVGIVKNSKNVISSFKNLTSNKDALKNLQDEKGRTR